MPRLLCVPLLSSLFALAGCSTSPRVGSTNGADSVTSALAGNYIVQSITDATNPSPSCNERSSYANAIVGSPVIITATDTSFMLSVYVVPGTNDIVPNGGPLGLDEYTVGQTVDPATDIDGEHTDTRDGQYDSGNAFVATFTEVPDTDDTNYTFTYTRTANSLVIDYAFENPGQHRTCTLVPAPDAGFGSATADAGTTPAADASASNSTGDAGVAPDADAGF